MTVTTTRAGSWAPSRLTMRLAAALLMDEGVMRASKARSRAESWRTGDRSRSRGAELAREAMQPLVDDGLVVLAGGDWVAADLGDLAAWIADGMEAREDAGVQVIPAPRAAA